MCELQHHGIRGMKWGIRRYQNPDGSLTPKGKKHYRKDDGSLTKAGERKAEKLKEAAKKSTADVKQIKSDYKNITGKNMGGRSSSNNKNKSVQEMTDVQLAKANARLRMEKEYVENTRNKLMAEKAISDLTPQQVSKGEKFIKGIGDVVVPAVKNSAQAQLTKWLNKKIGEAIGVDGKELNDATAAIKKEADKLHQDWRKLKYETDIEDLKRKQAERKVDDDIDKKNARNKPTSSNSSDVDWSNVSVKDINDAVIVARGRNYLDQYLLPPPKK